MKLLKLNPTGILAYGSHDYIDLDNCGIVLLQGQNGSGKSSLPDALCEILWGLSPRRDGVVDTSENDVVNKGLGKSFGVVEFEQAGNLYRVSYLRNWKGPSLLSGPSSQEQNAGGYSGTTVYFERFDGSTWVQKDHDGRDLRMPKMADTWKRVSEVAGIDFDSFCNSSYVPQDAVLAFVRGKNSEREEILTKLMRLGVYDEAELRAREKAVRAKQHAAEIQASIDVLRAQESRYALSGESIEKIRDRLEQATASVQAAEAEVVRLEAKVNAERVLSDAVAQEVIRLQDEQAEIVQQIHAKASDVQKLQADISSVKQKTQSDKASFPTSSPELEAAQKELAGAKAAAVLENQRLTTMLPGAGRCPSCGSVLDDATLGKHKGEQAQLVSAALSRVKELEDQALLAKGRLEAQKVSQWRAIDLQATEQVTKLDAAISTLAFEILSLETEKAKVLASISQAQAKTSVVKTSGLEVAREAVRVEQAKLSTTQVALQIFEQRQSDLAKLVSSREVQERQLEDVLLDVQEWAWLAKHVPRVKQLKFETGSSYLNASLARNLDVLTAGATRVTLNPFKLKKEAAKKNPEALTVDDYIFRFELVVEEDGKEGVPVQMYSGGERERIVLALVLAFWELAASQGGGTNVLFLDESLSFLDHKSIEQVVGLLEQVRARIGTIVLVCHDEALSSLLRPDEIWTAVKRGGMTKIEVSN